MKEDKTQIPDSGIQEQIKLDVAGPETLDSPVPERTTGNVIDISGDLIDKIMAEQSVSHEASASPEGRQEWEKPQEAAEPPRRGRRPKNKEAPAQGEKPKRKGRPPKSEKQAPGGGGTGKTAKTPRQGKAASQPAPAKEEAPPPPAPAPEEQTQPKDTSRGEKSAKEKSIGK